MKNLKRESSMESEKWDSISENIGIVLVILAVIIFFAAI